MAECRIQDWKRASTPESVSRHETSIPRTKQRNIFSLLAQRELSPRTKNQAKNLWTKPPRLDACPIESKFWGTYAQHDLLSWAEAEFLHWWIPKYCPLTPSSKATIAAAFSTDGRVLASTQ
ncbi:hypothetical protein Zm00014a_004512 [Zea mays]|uniref:Transducin family protein / WD-40 repeat family protein n=2 Tax=Zea mays TaxID=4577 RepID=A0A979HIX9_MAIZE|nr:Transducin family protein / WD-40 repeat family protein [Zea mays]PWZ36535.1 hypothetical protein Zm00014a_004512 [Zea mays]PWZ36536.1 hypothetical protein Zm00014a_004512 [Zea mays]